jgi:hypothetical protein
MHASEHQRRSLRFRLLLATVTGAAAGVTRAIVDWLINRLDHLD